MNLITAFWLGISTARKLKGVFSMSNQETIEKYRHRLAAAQMESLQRRTGGILAFKEIAGGDLIPVALSEPLLIEAMEIFEGVVRDKYGRLEAERKIIDHYQGCWSNSGKLTRDGHDFMNDLIDEVVGASDEPTPDNAA
jgi:hypothetical protein